MSSVCLHQSRNILIFNHVFTMIDEQIEWNKKKLCNGRLFHAKKKGPKQNQFSFFQTQETLTRTHKQTHKQIYKRFFFVPALTMKCTYYFYITIFIFPLRYF